MTSDMTKGSPLRLIAAFAVPMLVGNIFQQVYNFVDTYVVGRFVGDTALAAVGATSGLAGILVSFVMGFTSGAGIIISQYIGALKYDGMKRTVTALGYIVLIMSLVITAVGLIFSKPLLSLLSTPDEIIDSSAGYIKVIFAFVLSSAVYNATSAVLRSLGDSRTPLAALIISSFVNVALDLLFVAVFRWGIPGAAVATGIAQIVSAVFNIIVMYTRRRELNLESISIKPDKMSALRIIKTGLPAALESCLLSLGGLSVQKLVNSFGSATIAAYTAATKIDSIAIAPVVSVGSAISVFTGQNMGAGKIDRIRKGLYQTMFSLIALCFVIAVLIVIFRRSLLGLFLSSEESIMIGSRYLVIVSVAYCVAAVMRSYLNLLRGAGDVNTSAIAGLSELGARIVFAYILVIPLGSTGIWLATPIAWSFGALIPVIRYYSGKWLSKKLV
ncbi:MAG: MATE family efflux transporter [Firmicutes bacterium]|nr:MATE family efflux transporter [Bacillota bacterium]